MGRGSPLVDTDARAAALLRLMLEAIDLRLSELRYMAAEGGLSLEIVNHSFNSPVAGLRLALLGWAGRVETLLCDVVRAIAEHGAAGVNLKVSQLISPQRLISCSTTDTLEHVRHLMNVHHIRHLPVIDDFALAGVISMRDVSSAFDEAAAPVAA